MTQEVFKRYEKKYLLTLEQFQAMTPVLKQYMQHDQYGKHTICNLYMDTPDYELIRTSLEKPLYKEKLRLRSYGTPKDNDTVFLELKKKFDGIVYKRRTPLPLKEAMAYLKHGLLPKEQNQIFKEIDFSCRRYELIPQTYLAYERIALFGKEQSELRMTFDCNIRGRDQGLDLAAGTYGVSLLDANAILLEVKIPDAMPIWMSRLFSELGIFSTSFSKYGTYYKDYIWKGLCEKGGVLSA